MFLKKFLFLTLNETEKFCYFQNLPALKAGLF